MTAELTRAKLLREHGRHAAAVGMILSHLAHHPEDPEAFLELAINRMEIPGELKHALEDSRRATGLMPGNPVPIALQSQILSRLNRHKEALPMAESAIALEPEFEYAWIAKSAALLGLTRWADAEQAAREALAIDPDNETASNLLAHTLRLQNRLDESEGESRRRLARNPEDAFSFANAGWSALQRGQVKEAENYFKESLRIDPEMEYARDGLKQSYRARSRFFRIFLKWSFFLQRFSEGNRLAIMIGLIIGFRLLRTLFAAVHPLLVIPLAFVYYLFIFGVWISSGLANFFLLSDANARLALDRSEKVEGVVVGTLFLGGLLTAIIGLALGQYAIAVAGGVMMIAAIPASMIFTNPSPAGRIVFSTLGSIVLACGAGMVTDIALHPGRELLDGGAGLCFNVVVLTAVGCTWLGAIPKLRNAKVD